MSWRDTVQKLFRRQAAGQVAALSRGASGDATMPRQVPTTPDSGMSGAYMQLATMLSVDTDLMLRFADYENMDDYPEVSAALDIYADDATVTDTVHESTIWGTSKDKVIRDIVNDLLERRLHIEDEIWTAIRTLCKYGNLYAEVVANEKGVLGLNWLPPPTMRRIVDQRGTLVGFVQDPSGAFAFNLTTQEDLDRLRQQQGTNGAVFFSPWEVVHWRLRGKQMRALYGFCERKTAKVTTTVGVKEIQHLRPGDEVETFDGFRMQRTRVLDVVCNGTKKVFSVKTRHRENFVTAEHPICVFDPEVGFRYTPVQELCKGDRLVVPRPPEFPGRLVPTKLPDRFSRVRLTEAGVVAVQAAREGARYFFEQSGINALCIAQIDQFCAGKVSIAQEDFDRLCALLPCVGAEGMAVTHGRGRGNFVRCPAYVDQDFAWLFGLLLGDGWTSQGRDVGIAVGLDEAFNERIVYLLRSYGLDPHPRYQRVVDEESGVEQRVLRQYTVCSADLVDMLHDLGFIDGAHNKRIPQWVYESPREIREAVLRGFVDADGWNVNQHGVDGIRIEVCNYDLSRDLKALIDGLGWTCGNVCVRQRRTGEVSTHPAMRGLAINSGPGYILSFHTTPLFDSPVRLEQVISITEQPTEPEEVYDIQVDADTHNFVADGMVVHNSLLDSSRWVWKRLLMLEDSSLVCKLTKAPARFAFYIDTGEIPPREARAVVDDVRRRYKKKRIMDPATGKLDFRFNPLCLSLDTRIPLLNGTTRTLRDLIMDHEAGVQNYVYSMDPETKRVKPGTISWAGVTRRDAKVVRVTLDNCRSEVVTPDHQFLMRDGTYKQAQLLEPGGAVMSWYQGTNVDDVASTVNHKVASVEWLDGTMDTGCITVDGWHNFAVDAGVFVKNSQDEDIFIPTRAGKDATRVEVLSGPDYDDTGVLGYFLKKLFSSLRIPPQYIGGTEVTNRAALTQEDVQFARLEMRIQREFITGLRQVVRVHLAALNIDPDSVKWDLKMPAPSSIFEMQQVEVWNARAGLAAALQPFFTAPWIMANIFHMSDEDALFAAEAKTHEAEAQALGQASIQAEIMRQFPELGPEGAMALGAPPPIAGMMAQGMAQPGQEQIPQESIKRIEKALHQLQESNDRVTRSVERTDSAVSRIGQRFRAISQTNQSRQERAHNG